MLRARQLLATLATLARRQIFNYILFNTDAKVFAAVENNQISILVYYVPPLTSLLYLVALKA